MKIGTDVNLWTCRAEGYLMMEYNSRKLIKKGVLQKDVAVTFTATAGYHSHNAEGHALNNEYTRANGVLAVDVDMCWDDVMELYEQHREGISRFAGHTECAPNFDNPTVYDFLQLADDVRCYCGLN